MRHIHHILILSLLGALGCPSSKVEDAPEQAISVRPKPPAKKLSPPVGPWRWVTGREGAQMSWKLANVHALSGCYHMVASRQGGALTLRCRDRERQVPSLWENTWTNLPGVTDLPVELLHPDGQGESPGLWTLAMHDRTGDTIVLHTGDIDTGEVLHTHRVRVPRVRQEAMVLIVQMADDELRTIQRPLGGSRWDEGVRHRWRFDAKTNRWSEPSRVKLPPIDLNPRHRDPSRGGPTTSWTSSDGSVHAQVQQKQGQSWITLRTKHTTFKSMSYPMRLLSISQVTQSDGQTAVLLTDHRSSHWLLFLDRDGRVLWEHKGGSGYRGPRTAAHHSATMELFKDHVVVSGKSWGDYVYLLERRSGRVLAFLPEYL